MNLENQKIDWNSPNVLSEIVKKLEAPLSSIIEANQNHAALGFNNLIKNNLSKDIILSNSEEIKRLIDELVKKINGGREVEPLIFQIYNSNKKVQAMCTEQINTNRISKQDTLWLHKLENEVFKKIKYKDLNLYDLSYTLSVSERQLHRKTKSLLHLTPNKYIRVLKLHKAKQLIEDYLYDTISQISYAVGYYDTHYFSKLFRQQYGLSPKELLTKTIL